MCSTVVASSIEAIALFRQVQPRVPLLRADFPIYAYHWVLCQRSIAFNKAQHPKERSQFLKKSDTIWLFCVLMPYLATPNPQKQKVHPYISLEQEAQKDKELGEGKKRND